MSHQRLEILVRIDLYKAKYIQSFSCAVASRESSYAHTHMHYRTHVGSVCARYKNPFAGMSGVGFEFFCFCPLATGAAALPGALRWKRSRSRGQGENRTSLNSFSVPARPRLSALRFVVLTSFSRPSIPGSSPPSFSL